MSKRTAESSPEQQEPAKKSKCAAESSPEQQEPAKKICLNTNEDHKFKPADVIFAACKKGETAQPDEFLVGSRFATGKEVESVDLATARVVLTGGMSGLTMTSGSKSGSTAQKKEAERRWIALGGNKWQTAVSGKTTILVCGPRKWWK